MEKREKGVWEEWGRSRAGWVVSKVNIKSTMAVISGLGMLMRVCVGGGGRGGMARSFLPLWLLFVSVLMLLHFVNI